MKRLSGSFVADLTPHSSLRGRVFTISPSRSSFVTIARALMSGRLIPGFQTTEDFAVFVPGRSGVSGLGDAFLEVTGGRGSWVPSILSVADMDASSVSTGSHDLPSPISDFARHLALTKLILSWQHSSCSDAELAVRTGQDVGCLDMLRAGSLASEFMKLTDQITETGLDWSDLASPYSCDYGDYSRFSADFLENITLHWSRLLSEQSWEDCVRYRDRVIRQRASALCSDFGPLVFVYTPGMMLSSVDLMKSIVCVDRGAVVLLGLDLHLDEETWTSIPEGKPGLDADPQCHLKFVLRELGLHRDQVQDLDPETDPTLVARTGMVSEVMRPASSTGTWAHLRFPEGITEGLSFIEAKNEMEEALSLAILFREAFEQGKTAALVTPDGVLAYAVTLELKRFGLNVDDATLRPITSSFSASLARLLAVVSLNSHSSLEVTSLIRHPMLRLGLSGADAMLAAKVLELSALRSAGFVSDLSSVVKAFKGITARGDEVRDKGITSSDLCLAETFLFRLMEAIDPLVLLRSRGQVKLSEWLHSHIAVLTAAAGENTDIDPELTRDWERFTEVLSDLAEVAKNPVLDISVSPEDYVTVLTSLMSNVKEPVTCRVSRETNSRIHIWTPSEAPWRKVDILVLGSLVEGVWPRGDLLDNSRLMRVFQNSIPFGKGVGPSAYAMAQGLVGAPEVVLTRSLKVGGVPTTLSRWMQRLRAVVGEANFEELKKSGQKYLSWSRMLDSPYGQRANQVLPLERPCPVPPLQLRPTRLSIGDVVTWMRDPYSFYARHVLKLNKLKRIRKKPEKLEVDRLIRKVIQRFVNETAINASVCSDFSARETMFRGMVEEELRCLVDFPSVAVLCHAKLSSIGSWLIPRELGPANLLKTDTKVEGSLSLFDGKLHLKGTIDRLDVLSDDKVLIINYGTGLPFPVDQTGSGVTTQLLLQAMMMNAGAFGPEYQDLSVAGLVYVHLIPEGQGGKWKDYGSADELESLIQDVQDRLRDLVQVYEDPKQGYLSRPDVSRLWKGEYDHLSRVAEWSLIEDLD